MTSALALDPKKIDVLDRGPWMQTHLGRVFFPGDPRPEDIFIEDIAYPLAMMCRYGGHTTRWRHVSIAEHSSIVAQYVFDHHESYYGLKGAAAAALCGLLHDAAEAYCGDMIASVKALLPEFKTRVEHPIQEAVWLRFGVRPTPDVAAFIKMADCRIPRNERDAAMTKSPHPWNCDRTPPLPFEFQCLPPERAHAEFMGLFNRWAREIA